jgi:adenine-specific DNA-methyltransferase
LPRSDEQASRFTNPDDDPRGPWRTYPLDVRTENEERRAGYRYEVTLPSGRVVRPAQGRHWALPKDRFENERAAGLIWFGVGGNAMPTKKVYLAEAREGVLARTWWPYKDVGGSQDAKKELKALFPEIEPFTTPKPERLLKRIIEVASSPGDILLDCFLGSGTTAAVAQKMGRRWIGVEGQRTPWTRTRCLASRRS